MEAGLPDAGGPALSADREYAIISFSVGEKIFSWLFHLFIVLIFYGSDVITHILLTFTDVRELKVCHENNHSPACSRQGLVSKFSAHGCFMLCDLLFVLNINQPDPAKDARRISRQTFSVISSDPVIYYPEIPYCSPTSA